MSHQGATRGCKIKKQQTKKTTTLTSLYLWSQ